MILIMSRRGEQTLSINEGRSDIGKDPYNDPLVLRKVIRKPSFDLVV